MPKAFSFGVLNTQETHESKLVLHAIVSPDLFKANNRLLYSERINTELFEELLCIPDVAYGLASLHAQLAVPPVPVVYLGKAVLPVKLEGQPDEDVNSRARALLRTMGRVDPSALDGPRELEKTQVQGTTVDLTLPYSTLQECALRVNLPAARIGYAYRIDHVTKDLKTQIGQITVLFLPDARHHELPVHP